MPEVLVLDPGVSESRPTEVLGAYGEAVAVRYLQENVYRIVMTNFTVPVGRNARGAQVTGEIDIIALDGETLCFIEVKTRRSEAFTPVITAIDRRKQRQITRTARVYRRLFNVFGMPYRFDAVTVLVAPDRELEIELIKNLWSETKFRKRSWSYEAWQDHF